MAIIALEGIRFFGHHGFYEEEQTAGNEFVLDVYLDVDVSDAAVGDDLFATVNYETVFLICQSEMRKPSQLLEALAQRILDRIDDYFESVDGARVRVRKLNPPLGAKVDCAYVEVASGTLDPIPQEIILRALKKILG